MHSTSPASQSPRGIPELLENPAIQKHLDILQGIIERLAGNASTCKNWCITLVSGAVVLSFTADLKVKQEVVYHLAYALIAIFLLLDSYYHALERAFRDQSNALVRSIHEGGFDSKKLLVIVSHKGVGKTICLTLCASVTSVSTGGFYMILAAAVFLTNRLCQ
ncbi:MAG TPA: hypothetical protein VK717_05185 [Opitutaceae bacterium]|nr:hypothetical protein [Opitutaceae bacterium]